MEEGHHWPLGTRKCVYCVLPIRVNYQHQLAKAKLTVWKKILNSYSVFEFSVGLPEVRRVKRLFFLKSVCAILKIVFIISYTIRSLLLKKCKSYYCNQRRILHET
jgi:hypothetical protein